MRAVVTFEAQILQVRRVTAGTPVGYGGTFTAERESRIATVGAGYADGVPRLLSSRGRVYHAGAYCPIIGRVSMDMLHIDVTESGVDEGDWVELFGANVSVDEVAGHAETLSYEIIRASARIENSWFGRLLTAPGKALQLLTTAIPDDTQLEVSVAALKTALSGDTAAHAGDPALAAQAAAVWKDGDAK